MKAFIVAVVMFIGLSLLSYALVIAPTMAAAGTSLAELIGQ